MAFKLKIYAVLACLGMLFALVLTVALVADSFRRARELKRDQKKSACSSPSASLPHGETGGSRL